LQDIKKVPEDIAALKPTLFVGVPRVFDRLTAGQLALLDKFYIIAHMHREEYVGYGMGMPP
jgi:long-subunit acyl-CoA synthetase (AMP-forming)